RRARVRIGRLAYVHAAPDRDRQLLRRSPARAGNRVRRPGVIDKVNLSDALASFDEAFQPRIVGTYNDNKIQVAKTRGEFVWHSHPDTDDLFYVVKDSSRSSCGTGTSCSGPATSSS